MRTDSVGSRSECNGTALPFTARTSPTPAFRVVWRPTTVCSVPLPLDHERRRSRGRGGSAWMGSHPSLCASADCCACRPQLHRRTTCSARSKHGEGSLLFGGGVGRCTGKELKDGRMIRWQVTDNRQQMGEG